MRFHDCPPWCRRSPFRSRVRTRVRWALLGGSLLTFLGPAASAAAEEPPPPSRWIDSRPATKRTGRSLLPPPLIDERSPYPVPLPSVEPQPDGTQVHVWTLADALQRAMEANPDVVEARHRIEGQEGVRLQVQARLLPQVSGVATFDEREERLIDRSAFELGQPPSRQTAVAQQSYDARLEIRQLVFDGFSSWNQIKRQKLLERQAYLSLQNVASRTASLVRQVFDAVLMRQQILETEQRRIEGLQQLVEVTRRKRAAGEIPEFEQLRAETELQSAQADLAQAKRGLLEAEETFRRLLQVPATGERLRLEGTFGQRHFTMDFRAAVEAARAHRSDLESAQLQVEASKLQQRSILGLFSPSVELYASYGTRSSYYDFNRALDGWTVGVMGRWNVFDGGENFGRLKSQRAERRIAESQLAEIQHQIDSQLSELFEGLAQTGEAIAARRKTLDLADRALHQARLLYDAGQASLEQILQAELSQRRAQNGLFEAVFGYNATVAQIEYATGATLPVTAGD